MVERWTPAERETRDMTSYKITSSAGVDMGTYEAESAAAALDAMAQDAGYESQAEAEQVTGEVWAGSVVEVRGTLHDYDTAEEIRPATVEEAEESASAARSDGGAGVITVGERRCYVAEVQG